MDHTGQWRGREAGPGPAPHSPGPRSGRGRVPRRLPAELPQRGDHGGHLQALLRHASRLHPNRLRRRPAARPRPPAALRLQPLRAGPRRRRHSHSRSPPPEAQPGPAARGPAPLRRPRCRARREAGRGAPAPTPFAPCHWPRELPVRSPRPPDWPRLARRQQVARAPRGAAAERAAAAQVQVGSGGAPGAAGPLLAAAGQLL